MIKYILLILLILLFPVKSFANDLNSWHIIEPNSLYVDVMHYTWASEPFMQPKFTPNERLDLHVDLDLLGKVAFFNNMIHSETDRDQFRLIGWNYRLGLHLGDSIDFFLEHFSQHILDATPQYNNTYDAIGLRVYMYKQKDK